MIKSLVAALAVLAGVGALPEGKPDTRAVVRMAGRNTFGHSCPVSENLGFTAAHVIDPRPSDQDFPLWAMRYENFYGNEGVAWPQYVVQSSDLGVVKYDPPVTHFYRVSQVRPKPGDKVFWVEYRVDKKNEVFKPEQRDAKVVTTFAGHIFVDDNPIPGASGGCVLNESNEVVGIISIALRAGEYSSFNAGGIVGVWGRWGPNKEK